MRNTKMKMILLSLVVLTVAITVTVVESKNRTKTLIQTVSIKAAELADALEVSSGGSGDLKGFSVKFIEILDSSKLRDPKTKLMGWRWVVSSMGMDQIYECGKSRPSAAIICSPAGNKRVKADSLEGMRMTLANKLLHPVKGFSEQEVFEDAIGGVSGCKAVNRRFTPSMGVYWRVRCQSNDKEYLCDRTRLSGNVSCKEVER